MQLTDRCALPHCFGRWANTTTRSGNRSTPATCKLRDCGGRAGNLADLDVGQQGPQVLQHLVADLLFWEPPDFGKRTANLTGLPWH